MSNTSAGYPFLYQVGDVVKVREDLEHKPYYMDNDKYNYANAVDEMIALAGKYVTIEEQYRFANSARYLIKEDHGVFYWTDEMFSDYAEEETIPVPNVDYDSFDWVE